LAVALGIGIGIGVAIWFGIGKRLSDQITAMLGRLGPGGHSVRKAPNRHWRNEIESDRDPDTDSDPASVSLSANPPLRHERSPRVSA